ncbi:MAG: hypothetical protein EAZ89_04990, partial [Bacteroidetes bacterium]
MRYLSILLILSLFYACQPAATSGPAAAPGFQIRFPKALRDAATDGRLYLMLAKDTLKGEPRDNILDGPETQQLFGMNVTAMAPDKDQVFDTQSFGYPLQQFADLPPGDYYVQALLDLYETYRLKDGRVLSLPVERGEGRQWNQAPGNLYSKPIKIHFDPAKKEAFTLVMDQIIPPVTPPEDTKYLKHIRIQSKLLSEFWGRPIYLGAHVLLPEGWDTHPDVKYPLAVMHGHFPADFGGFRTTAPDIQEDTSWNSRFRIHGYKKTEQEEAYNFYKQWTGPGFPRVIAIEIQHANPYYDDSYAVNSANLGPYGDAITYELIPYIEQQFRGIGQGWARFTYGGSTGGWEALAVQVKYPDEYNTCYAACPDPIDFRAYCQVNLYEDSNAYADIGPFQQIERPAHRDYLGHVSVTVRQSNYRELALGDKSRSGQQWDIWEAVYSPVGPDGYPARIWDKVSGKIDPAVAAYWKENYDLVWIMKRDWATLGPKLKGKVNIYCGDMDNYYLNNAVYLAEDFLEQTTQPYYDGEVDYGDRAEHCWNGDQQNPIWISRLRYHQMFIPKWTNWVQKNA